MSLPPRPPVITSSAESGLVIAARYEADLHMATPEARRRLHTVGALTTFAALVVGYDVLSLLLKN